MNLEEKTFENKRLPKYLQLFHHYWNNIQKLKTKTKGSFQNWQRYNLDKNFKNKK